MRHRLFTVALLGLAACAPASASTSVRTVAIGIHYSAFSLVIALAGVQSSRRARFSASTTGVPS